MEFIIEITPDKDIIEVQNQKFSNEIFLQDRKLYFDAIVEGSRSYDKAILTISGGAFGLSLSFISKIVPSIDYYTIWMLTTAWLSFCVSILSTLISFIISVR